MLPKVDTFSHDIADEIKRKDASLTEITAASNDVGNIEEAKPRKPVFLYVVIALFVVFVLSCVGAYIYFYQYLFPKQEEAATLLEEKVVKKTSDIKTISQDLSSNIGNFVSSVSKNEKGYTLFVSNYPAVFAYMTRNEDEYIEEIARAFYPQATGTAQKPATIPSIPVQQKTIASSTIVTSSSSPKVTTSTATTTKTGTSSASVSETATPDVVAPLSDFTDVTINNQNMRVWNKGGKTIVYAFALDKAILISNSTDGILSLRSAILR